MVLSLLNTSLFASFSGQSGIETFDIIINEIMADPDPVVDLPEYEYIELYNRSKKDIFLEDLRLIVGSKTREIPSVLIKQGEYLVLCPSGKSIYFPIPENCIEISKFPGLTNSGQSINIIDKSDNVICFVVYEKSWYKNNFKAGGGWSLEQIDPDNLCVCVSNWTASTDIRGGSPGYQNSVHNDNPDLKKPSLKRITVNGISEIILIFDKSMNITEVTNSEIYSIRDNYDKVEKITALPPNYSSVKIDLPFEMIDNVTYTIDIISPPKDYSGNELSAKNYANFSLPQNPDIGDIIINEILFDPLPGGTEFVELFNFSEKCIDLKDLYITNTAPGGTESNSTEQIFPGSFLLFSKEYILITENSFDIISRYNCPFPDRIIDVANLPSLNDKNGEIFLINRWENIIDELHYTENMHHSLLANNEGVSLERISSEGSSLSISNWHSASSSTYYASPGFKNSQSIQNIQTKGNVVLSPEIFSPDNDGYNDVLQIKYDFGKNGLAGSVRVYDANGRLVKELLNNGLFGSTGSFFWDGENSKNGISPVGIYIIYVEVFDMSGKVYKYKNCCVLAKKI